MTVSKTPIELQLQRNSSIIFKQKNIREYLPRESTRMLRKFETFRSNSLAEQRRRENNEIYSLVRVRRHSSELLLRDAQSVERKLPVRINIEKTVDIKLFIF